MAKSRTVTFWRRCRAARAFGFFLFGLLAAISCGAAESRPVVGPGATKDEVIDAYGWPTGQSQAGSKEILIYPQGRVLLDKGRVERVDFSLKMAWPAPRPRPGTAGAGESWFTSWPESLKEAERRHVRVLALFVGSDWSPPSRQFLHEVAEAPDFLTAVLGSFVLLKLDYPTRTTQLKALQAQNVQLRERFEVTTYPALVILESDGTLAKRVDLNQPSSNESYLAKVITAVREARESLPVLAGAQTPTVKVPTEAAKVAAPAPPPVREATTARNLEQATAATSASLLSAGWALTWGLVGGLTIVVVMLWLFWRRRFVTSDRASNTAAERVADAASGLPTALEMAEWSQQRLRAVVTGVGEFEGYSVKVRAGGAEGDLAFTRQGETRANVIVACLPAAAGPVSAKRLRELFGVITIEEVQMGWFVGLAGFSAEARDYAKQHGLVLIGKEGLREQLRALPEHDLARIFGRGR